MRESLLRWQGQLPGNRVPLVSGLLVVGSLGFIAMWAINLGPTAGPSVQPAYDPTLPPLADTQIGPWPVAVEVGGKLVAVIAFIYLLSAMAKRYLLRMSPLPQGNLRVVETRTLGPKRTLYLVEVGGRALLLGATDSTISNLAEFTDPDVVSELVGPLDQNAKLDFPRLLSAFRSSTGVEPGRAGSEPRTWKAP